MECNKDEAIRAKEIAEKKMEDNDFEGARRIAQKAQNLYPELQNITQLLSICDVHCSAQNKVLGSEKDWYGILQVEKFADESMVKKQYRRLALILHPDKNRFPGAEGAFKLICEANAVLSDPTKKSLYDNKIRVSIRAAPGNPQLHHINKHSQLNRQNGAQNNVPNGFSSLNQHQATRSTSSAKQEVFWTSCPYCGVKYQYLRQFVNRSLVCPTCSKSFIGYDIGAPLGSKSGHPGSQHMPSKPDSSRPAAFQETKVPNQDYRKVDVQNNKRPTSSNAGPQGITNRKSVRSEPGVRIVSGSEGVEAASAAKASGDLHTKETDIHNVNSLNGGKEGGKSNCDTINREAGDLKNKSRKRGRKLEVESSESCYSSIHSDTEDVTMKGDSGVRRSSRQRQHISYKETDEDDFASSLKRAELTKQDNGKEQKDASDEENVKHGNQNSYHASYFKSETKETGTAHSEERLRDKGPDHDVKVGNARGETVGKSGTGSDAVPIENDSDQDSISMNDSDKGVLDCPDPEFNDFDKGRDETCFDVNQFWACYDTLDGMPRFYAKVKKARVSPFELTITWLEADPKDKSYQEWVDEELPVGCGSFKLGKTENTSLRLSFSHQMNCEKGKKKNSLIIYPRKGEVWALFKDWDPSWSSDPENHKEFRYEIVEVLSDFDAGSGVKVCYLDKVEGFVSLFERASQSKTNSFFVGPNELYKFSHLVPCFKMAGSERVGVPVGSYELDPASLPLNPDDLYYPGKAKLKNRNTDPGVHICSPNSGKKKDNIGVSSTGTSTPKKFVDLEGIQGETSIVRRSPRGLNAIRQKAN